MRNIIVIPARYNSTRLPGKPLIDILGKSMIRRVYEKCIEVFPSEDIYVATENEQIFKHCLSYNIQCIITSDNCLTGTDRIAEVANIIEADNYINVQGDEPLFNPYDLKLLIENISIYKNEILNGFCEIDNINDYNSRSIPKVVFTNDNNLLYMSRSPIPGNKDSHFEKAYRQVCAYVFPKFFLNDFNNSKKTFFENIEDIEILRFLELGYKVRMIKMSNTSISVDNKEDLIRVISRLNEDAQH